MISFPNKQTGFTLVELLVVMLILVAMASVTIETTSELAFQNRYEVTKDRYEKIKRAIIGRPDALINGQPDISGFVADMGRLPRNIHELLAENYCSPDYRISVGNPDIPSTHSGDYKAWCQADYSVGDWHSASCSDATKDTEANCTGAGEIWNQWKGPYLTTQNPDYKPNAISDGWGNQALVISNHNYGWEYNLINTDTELNLQSKGKNGCIYDGTTCLDTETYDTDYPLAGALPSIRYDDWTVDITNGLMVRIQPPITFTPCDITTLANQNSCEVAGQHWFPSQRCEDTSKLSLASCTPSPFVWDSNNSTCIDSSKDFAACSTSPFSWETRTAGCEVFNATSCNGAGFNWNTTICESENKAFCDNYVSTPTPITPISLSLDLYHETNSLTFTTTSGSASIIENEQPQNLLFTGMNPSDIPQGMYKLEIKNGGTEYPTGHLPIFIYFVPNRTISTINW